MIRFLQSSAWPASVLSRPRPGAEHTAALQHCSSMVRFILPFTVVSLCLYCWCCLAVLRWSLSSRQIIFKKHSLPKTQKKCISLLSGGLISSEKVPCCRSWRSSLANYTDWLAGLVLQSNKYCNMTEGASGHPLKECSNLIIINLDFRTINQLKRVFYIFKIIPKYSEKPNAILNIIVKHCYMQCF